MRKGQHIIAAVGRFLDQRLNHALCEEAEANAYLIARAPEMYEALDRIVEENKNGAVSAQAIENAVKVLAMAVPIKKRSR